mmetsp:Transcript_2147/g.2852  ORF Transcript_2147/g.2852 Transcript_2147/m.2852 type:complete len:95 (+) Transcript_2147:24-308(+)
MYGSYFPHEIQAFHGCSTRLSRRSPPKCEKIGPKRPSIETNFDEWLQLRKFEWNNLRRDKKDSYAPSLEQDFYGWLSARKSMWKSQRMIRKGSA